MSKFWVLIIASVLLVLSFYKIISSNMKKISASAANDCSSKILSITPTNNTYPPLLDVLASLDDDLSKLGIKLHADMRGYLYDAKKK